MALEIECCNHIALETRRLDESIRFYIDVLGAKEISRPAFPFRGAWLYLGGIQIHLIDEGAPEGRHAINTRTNHFACVVPDVDEAEQRLNKMGIVYKRNLIADRGIHQLFFQDPDGHTIEVGRYGIIDQ